MRMKVLVYNAQFCPKTQTFIYNEVFGVGKSEDVSILTHKRINKEIFPFDKVIIIPRQPLTIVNKINGRLNKLGYRYGHHHKVLSKKITDLVHQKNPTIIHLHFGPDAILFLDNYKIRESDRIFISFHGYDASRMLVENKAYVKRLEKIFRLPQIYPIVVSIDMFNRMNRFGLNLSRTQVLYYGANIEKFTPRELDSNAESKIFLQVSGFKEKKGHVYTIQAYKSFVDTYPHLKSKLILAGDGELLDSMKELVLELGISDLVEFPGFLTIEQTIDYMCLADVFVHHSVTDSNGDKEGIPNALIEAMAMELPIISTVHSGIPELIEDGVNGFLIKEKNITEYTVKMKEIYDWGKQSNNREVVLERFEIKKHVEKLISFYKKASNSN